MPFYEKLNRINILNVYIILKNHSINTTGPSVCINLNYQLLFYLFFSDRVYYVALAVLELYVEQHGLKFRDSPVSVTQVSGLRHAPPYLALNYQLLKH